MTKTIKKTPGNKIARPRGKASRSNIKKRAFEIYKNRIPENGSADDDWFRAEEELLSDPGY